MGYSDAGPGPRTTQQLASELTALLDNSDVRRPVFLVGASVGAWNIRLLASTHEDRVAGLVLVDPRHERQGPRLVEVGAGEIPAYVRWIMRLAPVVGHLGIARAAGLAPGASPDVLSPSVRSYAKATRFRASAVVAAASELGSAQESAEEVAGTRRALAAPLVIISAGQRQNSRVAQVLESLQLEQLQLSTRSCRVVAEASGHGIAFDQPQLVVQAIRAVIIASRADNAPNCDAIAVRHAF